MRVGSRLLQMLRRYYNELICPDQIARARPYVDAELLLGLTKSLALHAILPVLAHRKKTTAHADDQKIRQPQALSHQPQAVYHPRRHRRADPGRRRGAGAR